MMRRRMMCSIGAALWVAAALIPLSRSGRADDSTAADAERARAILEATGVQGGLIVHVGCGDGRLTAALRVSERYLVQGLAVDAEQVAAARDCIRKRGLYGPVSVGQLDGEHLPYVDNVVNLVVVSDATPADRGEILRVLAPHGVAVFAGSGDTQVVERIVKPRPKGMDDWPQFLYEPGNNAVSADRLVNAPTGLQWIDGPRWIRHHDFLAALSTMVSAGGRVFAITDECPVDVLALPPQWRLSARDAFNGVLLWQRKIGPWEPHLRRFRMGPPELLRRLVATSDRAYVTLGYGRPVVALDAATGQTRQTYSGTEETVEILLDGSVLYLVAGKIRPSEKIWEGTKPPSDKRILAVDADTGRILWRKADADTAGMQPMSLASCGRRVFFHSSSAVICLDAASGKELWRFARKPIKLPTIWRAPTLVARRDVVLCADNDGDVPGGEEYWEKHFGGKELVALDASTGRLLWKMPCAENYHSSPDVLVIDGLVWVRENPPWRRQMKSFGRNLRTGQIERTIETARVYLGTFHDRCHRAKATERFILTGSLGIELTDVREDRVVRCDWIRGGCTYGIMPANGILYVSPHACGCSGSVKLNGFYAVRPSSPREPLDIPAPALRRGPAFDRPVADLQAAEDDWPTFRGTAARTGGSADGLSADLTMRWKAALGGRLTQPTIAAGVVYVFSKDTCTLHALRAANGRTLWTFVTGSRCDTPPTIADGRVVLGCRDGYVYCLHPDDGALIWRFRAAPRDRRIVAHGRIESLWPVHGGVLVADGRVSCVAGYNSCLDGGLRCYGLDLKTGEILSQEADYDLEPTTHLQPFVKDARGVNFGGGRRADVLSAKLPGGRAPTAFASGMLDPSMQSRMPWRSWGKLAVSAALLVCQGQDVYGFGCHHVIRQPAPGDRDASTVIDIYRGKTGDYANNLPYPERDQWRLFKCSDEDKKLPVDKKPPMQRGRGAPHRQTCRWSTAADVFVRAMAVAGDNLAVAGPPALDYQALDATVRGLQGQGPGRLCIVSCETGNQGAVYPLDSPPVFDGLAVAGGSVYVSLASGEVECWSAEEDGQALHERSQEANRP